MVSCYVPGLSSCIFDHPRSGWLPVGLLARLIWMQDDHMGMAGAGVWVTTKDGWVRGDRIVQVRFKRGKHSSYGKEVHTFYVTVTQFGVDGDGGPSTHTLWKTEGGDGRALARAAASLLEFISGSERGVVVYEEGKAKLISFTEALLASSKIVEATS